MKNIKYIFLWPCPHCCWARARTTSIEACSSWRRPITIRLSREQTRGVEVPSKPERDEKENENSCHPSPQVHAPPPRCYRSSAHKVNRTTQGIPRHRDETRRTKKRDQSQRIQVSGTLVSGIDTRMNSLPRSNSTRRGGRLETKRRQRCRDRTSPWTLNKHPSLRGTPTYRTKGLLPNE